MILTVLFTSPLCFNKRKRAAAAAGQKSVCGQRYHGSRYGPKNSNLIEKKVSEQTVKLRRHDGFSPFFLRRPFVVMIACERRRRRRKISLGARNIRGDRMC
jgi:hypothetical protein